VNVVPGKQTATEDTQLSISGLSVSDPDGNLVSTKLTVLNGKLNVNVAGGAAISAGANDSATLTLSGTEAQINAALATVKYTPNANVNGTAADTLTMLSTDSTGTPLTDSDNVTIDITAVNNDAPVNVVPGVQAATEDTQLSISGLSVSDPDGNLASTKLTVLNGVLNVSVAGGATISAGANDSATLTLSGTETQIKAALATVKYTPNANVSGTGADKLTMLSTDSTGTPLTDSDTVAIDVAAVNDAPVNTVPGALTTNEDTAKVITGLAIADVDAGTSNVTVTLAVTHGTITVASGTGVTLGTNGTASVTLTGKVADINTLLAASNAVSYAPTANYNGSDTLTMTTNDGGNTGTGGAKTDTDTVGITVTAVNNDAPVNVVPGKQTATEDTQLSISGLSVSDTACLQQREPVKPCLRLRRRCARRSACALWRYAQCAGGQRDGARFIWSSVSRQDIFVAHRYELICIRISGTGTFV
jgi:hypothetical protein